MWVRYNYTLVYIMLNYIFELASFIGCQRRLFKSLSFGNFLVEKNAMESRLSQAQIKFNLIE